MNFCVWGKNGTPITLEVKCIDDERGVLYTLRHICKISNWVKFDRKVFACSVSH